MTITGIVLKVKLFSKLYNDTINDNYYFDVLLQVNDGLEICDLNYLNISS